MDAFSSSNSKIRGRVGGYPMHCRMFNTYMPPTPQPHPHPHPRYSQRPLREQSSPRWRTTTLREDNRPPWPGRAPSCPGSVLKAAYIIHPPLGCGQLKDGDTGVSREQVLPQSHNHERLEINPDQSNPECVLLTGRDFWGRSGCSE